MKKFIGMILTAVIIMNSATLIYADEQIDTQSGNEGGTTAASGYIPGELDNDVPVYKSDYVMYSEVPGRFPDSIDVIKSTYPDSRNQNPYGTCWAFSSVGLAEFDLIKDGVADRNIDLSELQLVYFLFNSVTDPLGGTEGDYTKYYNDNAQNNYLNYGGNYEMAAKRLTQWVGTIPETDVPYTNAASVLSGGLDSKYAYNYNVAHLHNVYRISLRQNSDDVKRQIMEHGAVGAMYYHDDFSLSTGIDGTEYNYYDTAFTGGGHAVMIVGWDDAYSKENFIWNKPANDGAWLIRNSWGSYIDYFWMSYDTVSLTDAAWVFDFAANDGYDNNYQLDGGLETSTTGYTTMANVFTAKEADGVKSETLKAVSLSTMRVANVNYTIEVYTDLADEKNPLSGTKQESATTQGTTAYAGIYTIQLNEEVTIAPGSKFAIVVTADQNALDCEQATSIANGEDFSNIIWDCRVSQYNEKTFYKSGGKFYAFPWGNLCVKAFTSDNVADEPEKVEYTITYELNGGVNDASNPVKYTEGNSTIVLKNASREGYTFEGWYTDAALNNKITQISEGSAGNYTLYAKWKKIEVVKKEYSISYELNGGVNDASNPVKYTEGNSTIVLKNASREGYTFEGWYTDAALNNKITQISEGSAGNYTLYAKWKKIEVVKKEYSISYELNGGVNDASNPIKYTEGNSTIVLKNASREGYTFEGWYTDAALSNKITQISEGSTGNYTLYAKWKKIQTDNKPTDNKPADDKPIDNVTAYVGKLYEDVLGRTGSAAEINSWVNSIKGGQCSLKEAVYGFVFSGEYLSKNTSNEQYIDMLYNCVLGRKPDAQGKAGMLKGLSDGYSREYILSVFVDSPEFTSMCDKMNVNSGNSSADNNGNINTKPDTDSDKADTGSTKPDAGNSSQDTVGSREEGVAKFVSRCYEKILSRKYDVDGFNGWCNALLNNVLTPEQVVIEGFFGSQELNDKNITDEEYIKILYRAFLDREADPKEVADWLESKQRQNLSRDRIIHEFANSPEFLALMARYGL